MVIEMVMVIAKVCLLLKKHPLYYILRSKSSFHTKESHPIRILKYRCSCGEQQATKKAFKSQNNP